MAVKSSSKVLLVAYILFLLWLLLFKTSIDFSSVISDYQFRSLNLIPFLDPSREMIDNLIVFVPLGLLLSVNLKRVSLWPKLAFVFGLSLAVEILQYALAIGTTDITDLIMNTLGGLLGLALYGLIGRYVDNEKLDRFIVITGTIILIALLYLRFFVLRVRY